MPHQTLGSANRRAVPRVLRRPGREWNAGRRASHPALDRRPHAVAFPRDEAEVADVVRYAAQHGLRIAPQRIGRNTVPLGSLEETVLMRTDHMSRHPVVYRNSRRARVTAGARWGDVIHAAGPFGLTALHGTAPHTGVVDHSLAGGLNWYARKHGLATNRITAIELMTAEGRVERIGPQRWCEPFWALRGGGGNFGVVTALEFELLPVGDVYAGTLFFPSHRAREVLAAWRDWVVDVPEELTSIARLVSLPDRPEIPDALRGNSYATIAIVHLGPGADDLLAPLRALHPELDTFAPRTLEETLTLHMDPPNSLPQYREGTLASGLSDASLDGLVAVAGLESGTPLTGVEIWHTGGALARSDPDHGAFDTLPGNFAVFAAGIATDPESAGIARRRLRGLRGALSPCEVGVSLSAPDAALDPLARFDPDQLARLRRVKQDVDPDGVFHTNPALVR